MADLLPLRRNRDFVLLQTGQALSTVGSEASGVAYTLLVLALTHSPAKAGLTGFARLIPWVLFALPAGVVVDRWNRKHVMIVSDVVRVVALASLGVVAAMGRLSFAQIPIVAFVEGSMLVFFNIAEIGAVRSVVPTPQLQRAFATEQARLSSVYLAGPPLGGFLFGVGRSLPFLVDAVSYAFSTGTLLAMRTPFQEEREEIDTRKLRAQIAEGFAWLWRHTFLRTCALLFVGTNFAFGALELTLIVAARRQGLHSAAIGGLLAVWGALSLAGSVAAPRFHKLLSMRTILVGSSWLALTIAAYLVEPNVFVLVAGTAPFVFFNPTVNAMIIGYRVAIVPDRLQGRVNSVARSLALLGLPLGPVVAGLLLGSFSARTTVTFLLAGFVVLAVVTTASRSIRTAPSFVEVTEGAGS
ncbi:MAG: MFS transporter [Actinobacteria bacterium]|nr:MAG: MFS transporter [Actinomycetota bacterium]